jgi:hypothetical protein
VFYCEKCGNICDSGTYRFSFYVQLSDMTGSVNAKIVGDAVLGKIFTGLEISEAVQISKEDISGNKLRNIISKQCHQYFKVKLKAHLENDSEKKISLMVENADYLDYSDCSNRLREKLKNFPETPIIK